MNITEAVRETLDEFLAMSSDDLDKLIEQHKEGDVAQSLLESGCFDDSYHNKIKYYQLVEYRQELSYHVRTPFVYEFKYGKIDTEALTIKCDDYLYECAA
jgi:hypothetical protein